MGKIRRFLGFLVFMCTVAFGATTASFAEEITLHWVPAYGDAPADTTCTYGETFDVPMGPEVTGRNFVSWTTNGQAFVPGQTGVDCTAEILGVFGGTVTFNGSFTPIHYSITYVLNGGTNSGLNKSEYTIDSGGVSLYNPTRSNSSFKGWYNSPTFSGSKVTKITAGTTGNRTLYAKWACVSNYNDNDNDNVCTLNQFSIPYDCGTDATGTPPATTIVTYSETFTTAQNTCTKDGYQFGGWRVSGTGDVKPAGKSFTWTYSTAKTLTAEWVLTPGNCTIGQYYDSVSDVCRSCPSGYTSDLGGTDITDCYTTCQTSCIPLGVGICNTDITHIQSCTYNTEMLVDGIQHYGSTSCSTDNICDFATVTCQGDYYDTGDYSYYNSNHEINTNVCASCSKATGGAYPNSVITYNVGINSCLSENTYDCRKDLDILTPDKATCSLPGDGTVNGVIYYPNPKTSDYIAIRPGISCSVVDCVCESGYTFNMATNTCELNVYTITLDDNGGGGGVGAVYEKYSYGFLANEYDTTTITHIDNLPTKENKVFFGYWDPSDNTSPRIDRFGDFVITSPYYYTDNVTLYARWVDELFDCTTGQSANGTSCEPGYYCPGETVIKTERLDSTTGCQRLCPAHPNGDPVTSPAGSDDISDCYSTTSGVDLDNGTGGGDQVCSYHWDDMTNTGDFTTTCEDVDIKYCNAGYYYDATIDPTTCIEVGEGYSSPDPIDPNYDPASMGRYPNTYTITYDCGTGTGTAPTTNTSATYNASFTPSGVGGCTKTGHSFTGWKVGGTETVVNSAFNWTYPSNKTLTAQWSPNVYTITLVDTDATTHGAPSTLYMKYGVGWYTDAGATTPITNLTTLPTKSGFEFESYSLSGVQVIDENGVFLSNTFTSTPATLSVVWAAGKVNCNPGEYYKGVSTTCDTCDVGFYCPGGEFTMFSNTISGRTACPAGGTSYAGANGITSCYKLTETYVAPSNGSGTQDCYYNTNNSSYEGGVCMNNTITKCKAGYYFEPTSETANASTPDCIQVGIGYYSPANTLDRFECPSTHPLTLDATTVDVKDCYNTCTMAPNAKEMTGRNYYDPNHTGSCAITLCLPGYHLDNGACVTCPENSYCDGTAGTSGDGSISCTTLGSGDAFTEWKYSPAGSDEPSDCYSVCSDRAVTNGHAYPIEGKETVAYNNLCEFYGISTPQNGATRGNPCDVTQLASGVCVESACHSEFEMIDGVCKPCARDANALTYAPTGNCIVASCTNGYHPDGYICADDVVSCTASIPNAASAYSEWKPSAKSYGICTVETCVTGYHKESNACVLNEQTCDVPHGVGTQEWNPTLNTWGACVVTSCDAGYTNDDNPNQCTDCPNKYKEGGDLAVSSYVRGCEIASCMYQGEKYVLEGGDCLPICTGTAANPTIDPDGKGMKYWDSTNNRCVRTCLLPGYIKY